MSRMDSFLPLDRRLNLTTGKEFPEFSKGAVLFADVSGFTSLTENLASLHGAARGPELVTQALNLVFGILISEIHRYGGCVISFAGDAILCWFSEDNGLRALATGLQLQTSLEKGIVGSEFLPYTDQKLKVKVSVSAGQVRRLLIKDSHHSWVDTVVGDPVNQAISQEKSILKGEVVTDLNTALSLGEFIQYQEYEASPMKLARILRLNCKVAPQPWPSIPPLPDAMIRPWIDNIVYEKLDSGGGIFQAELRTAISLFFYFDMASPTTLAAQEVPVSELLGWIRQLVSKFEGHFMGMTPGTKPYFFVSFGALIAHDDDVYRALMLTKELEKVSTPFPTISGIRLGMTQGRVYVGTYGSPEYQVFSMIGDETNLAARLMQYAALGQVVISKRIAEYASSKFELQSLGTVPIKGKKIEVEVFLLGEILSGKKNVWVGERRSIPLVGREKERQQVLSLKDEFLTQRESQSLFIVGEAGIGKSKFVQQLAKDFENEGLHVLRGYGDSIEQSLLYRAWRPIFLQIFGIEESINNFELSRERVEQWFYKHFLEPHDRALLPLLGALLPFNFHETELTSSLVGHDRALAIKDLLLQILLRNAEDSLFLVLLEDAHWMDSASWTLVEQIIQMQVPLFLVLSLRSAEKGGTSFLPSLQSLPRTKVLNLEPLSKEILTEMLKAKLRVDEIPELVVRFIYDRAEGNPFFSEELLLSLKELGVLVLEGRICKLSKTFDSLAHLDIPETVQGVVTSRIDRLSASQQLSAKVASVVGRNFQSQIVSDIHPIHQDTDNLLKDLTQLARKDLIREELSGSAPFWTFTHAIAQEVCYSLLPYSLRTPLHQTVAEWFENHYPNDLSAYYPVLAHHWFRAASADEPNSEVINKALFYAMKAGEQALKSDGLIEALRHFKSALELVFRLPPSVVRDQQELSVQVMLAVPLTLTKGWADPDVGQAYERAKALVESLGSSPQMFLALSGIFTYYLVRAEFQIATSISNENKAIANNSGDIELLLESSLDYGAVLIYTGKLSESLTYFALVLDLYRPELHHNHAFLYGRDPGAVSLLHEALAFWYLGYPDHSLVTLERGLNLTNEWKHPFSRAWVLMGQCLISYKCGRYAEMALAAGEAIELAQKQGFPNWLSQAMAYLGWCKVYEGKSTEGLALMKQGISIWKMTGAVLVTPLFLGLLAEAHLTAGFLEEAKSYLDEAKALLSHTKERLWEPEIHRLEGILRFRSGDKKSALSFRRGLSLAQQIGALSMQLRIALDYVESSPSWKRTRKLKLLKPLYERFKEGKNTLTLVRAREMIQSLER